MANYNIREIALDTLVEILEHGEFSHIYLKQVLDKYAYFEKNERSFITRLVNGTVERKLELDFYINSYSKTKVNKMKPLIRTIIRMGVFEIYYMDSVPDSASCNEYVKLAKKRGFSGLSGFVNGVLRNVSRGKDNLSPSDLFIKYSMPEWIYKKWEADYGKDAAEEIAAGFFTPADLCIRVNEALITRDDLVKVLEEEKVTVRKSSELESALYISDFDSLAALDSFGKGLFYVQDLSSQMVAAKAQIKPADLVLDVCAAPGGKALHAAALASEGSVVARDLTDYKVSIINENIAKSQATNIIAEKWDATVFDEDSKDKYDVVIADLPCSGLGIIRKKPDIKYNQTEESLAELAVLQSEILDTVHGYVKAGGILSYSTCTINKDENENQVQGFITKHPEFEVIEQKQLLPNEEHDGFFICVLKKK